MFLVENNAVSMKVMSMDSSGPEIVNLRTVALKAGVSRSTASLALRNDPRLRQETISKVRKVAEALGYAANPYVAAFQTYVRSRAKAKVRATIAILDVISDRNTPEHISVRRIFQGATRRAAEQGFSTERFILNQSEIPVRRLEQILHTRRIEGVLIAPSPLREYRIIGLDWSRYACATIGYRPHLPWYAPKEFFDMYPPETISLPPESPDELEGLPPRGLEIARIRFTDTQLIDAANKRREAIRAYLACITYTDTLIGRLLDTLDASPHGRNTLVVLTSDHGFHLGEKQHWHKFTLWQQSTRSLLIVAPPRQVLPGRISDAAVSLLDIAPTLADYCVWKDLPQWDGASIRPFVENPNRRDDGRYAITSYTETDHAVTTREWRYIDYGKGEGELYNRLSDPLERHNLASDPAFGATRDQLKRLIPAHAAQNQPPLKGLEYSEETGRWIPARTR